MNSRWGWNPIFQVPGVAMIFAVHMVLGSSAGVTENIKCCFHHHPTLHPSPRGVKLPPQKAMSQIVQKELKEAFFWFDNLWNRFERVQLG